MVPKEAKFWWDPEKKIWYTTDKKRALSLFKYADEATQKELESFKNEFNQKIEESSATTSPDNFDVPCNNGIDFYPFQKAGIYFAEKRESTLISDTPGLGKTIQAIGILNLHPEYKKILIICPASLKYNWEKECNRWMVNKYTITIVDSKTDLSSTGDGIYIINYDIVKKFEVELKITDWDLFISDEVHYMKNPKSQRTKYILGYSSRKTKEKIEPIEAKKKVFLTGTPIVNRPIEMWPILHYLDPDYWKSYSYYTGRYCGAHHNGWGWDVSGATNLNELQEKLRSTVMIRRLKKDVLKELPNKIRQIIEIEDEKSNDIVQEENEAFGKYSNELERLRAEVEIAKVGEFDGEYVAAVKKLKDKINICFTEMAVLRHKTAVAKIPYVNEHLMNSLESSEKIVIFCHHHDVIFGIAEELEKNNIKFVTFTGLDTKEQREEAIEKFQNDENCKVFIGGLKVAGVGITLTAASHVIFAELDWVPGNVSQAEDRCHRIGQKESVLIQHIILKNSLDARMVNMIVEKQDVIEKALNDMTEIQIPIIPVPFEIKNSDNVIITKKEIEENKEIVSDKERSNVHESLKILSGMCDGAVSLDDIGFNKIDTYIGHSLAGSIQLSDKQVLLGKKIIKKYHKQIPKDLYKEIFK